MSFSIPGITTQNTARDKMIKTCDAYVAFIASSFRVTEENLVFETVQSGPTSSFDCFLCS